MRAGDLITVRVPVKAARVEQRKLGSEGRAWLRVEMPLGDGGEESLLEELLPGERLEVVDYLMSTGEVIVRPLLNAWHCLEVLEGYVTPWEGGAA